MLAFQSLVDATVSTAAVVHALFDQLDANGSELVLFDINRLSGMEPFIDPAAATILSRLTDSVAATLRAIARHQRRSGFARGGRALDPSGPDRDRHAAARTRLAARDVLARAHRAAVHRSTTRCMAGTRGRRRSTWCGWAPSVREASARC